MFQKVLCLLGCLALSLSAFPALAQTGDEEARVTVLINPDGSKTVYQKEASSHQATATTTGADGELRGKIIYQLDSAGRYESGQVFAANGDFRFKTLYQYDALGRLAQEKQLAKDDSVRSKVVYNYDAKGRLAGYSTFDGNGKLLKRTKLKKSAAKNARATRSSR